MIAAMSRFALLFLTLVGLSTVAPAWADDLAGPALLRSAVTVADPVIRIGDLFDGAPANADVAVAHAPAPGESVVLDARWLLAVARAQHVAWTPASRFDQSVVTRASQLIGTDAVRAAVADAVAARGLDGDFDVQFDGAAPTLKLPVDAAPTIAVQQLNFDPQSGRFTAVVTAPADGAPAARAALAGRVFALADVVVPVRRLLPGEVIGEDDLQWTQLRADRVNGSVVVDPEQIVGHSPRRPIRAGQPIRANDLQVAIVMKKGTVVTMVLETPRMLITTQGKAMEDGAKGDLVQVVNTTSNRTVKAVVVDPTTVSVAAAAAPLSN
jgi:flagella basal body P-ring formation protein FlgA